MLGAIITPGLYRTATCIAGPLAPGLLARRARRGKEDPARQAERLGHASHRRGNGFLVWIHAASVGESLSVLPLIGRLLDDRPGLQVLVTSGTVTSAQLLAERLPEGAFHQYAPIDRPDAVCRFLDHWRPDIALWIESELWPNLVLATAARNIPMLLINARISARSAARWQRLPRLAGPLMRAFAAILAQSEADAARFRALGARDVAMPGNLKFDGPPPAVDDAALAALNDAVRGRPHWLAASTHPGEEAAAAEAHALLARDHPGLITLLCPRHPARGTEIAAELTARGLTVSRRSTGEAISPATDIYLADTLGEMGMLYRAAGIAFIGGSLSPHAGHNPVEAAQLRCAIVTGPDMRNFDDAAGALEKAGALQRVTNARDMATAVGRLLDDPTKLGTAQDAALACAGTLTGALARTLDALEPRLPAKAPPAEANHAGA